MLIILIISCICCIFGIYGIYQLKKANKITTDKTIQLEKQKILISNNQDNLKKIKQSIQNQTFLLHEADNEIKRKNRQLLILESEIQQKKNQMQFKLDKFYEVQSNLIKQKLADFETVSQKAAENYIETLEKDYKNAEAAHKQQITSLQEEYSKVAATLQSLKETRKATYQAFLKQQKIQANKDYYCLLPSEKDLQDIHLLQKIKSNLNKPRILSMLIWQTYWQPIAKKKFPLILQAKTVIGIYKITNTITNQCYIGQSLDVYKRWCDHCKAGLGIDTPVGNKLYKAIESQGLENFTFELLCKCDKEDLNEKEKYFIQLYQADTFGYNGTGGNK